MTIAYSFTELLNKAILEKARSPRGCGVLVIQDGKILSGTRIERHGKGAICGPGGSIEPGETPAEAAYREAFEEFGIKCHNLKPMGVIGGDSAIFLCTEFDGTPKTDEVEMTDPQWRTLSELKALEMFAPFEQSLELLDSGIVKFNPYHDRLGRFTSGGSASFMTIRTKDPAKQHWADMAVARAKEGGANSEDNARRISAAEDTIRSMLNEGAEVKLSGMDPAMAESTVNSIKTVLDRYPTTKDAFGGFTTDECDPGDFADDKTTMALFNSQTKFIHLNPKYYGNKEEFEKKYAESVEKTFHPKGTTADSVVVHEMGHAIDHYVSSKTIDRDKFIWNAERVSSRIWNNAIDKSRKEGNPLTGKMIRESLSGYGSKNHAEYLAEGFCEYLTSPSPRPTATHIGKRVEAYIKKAAKADKEV